MHKILIADDEMQLRDMLRETLSFEGFKVVTVPTVDQAMAVILQEPFDLIILDIQMGGQSGFSVLTKIRQLQNKIPVIIFSGVITAEIEKDARLAGATEVLSKHTGVSNLVIQIKKLISAKIPEIEVSTKKKIKKLLVVDDNDSVRHLIKDFFEDKKYEVLEASTGEEALGIVEKQHPTVVLLDVYMPGQGGLDTLEKLKFIDPQLGVVLMTGRQDDALLDRALQLGAYGYVLKPFDLTYLEVVVLSKLVFAS